MQRVEALKLPDDPDTIIENLLKKLGIAMLPQKVNALELLDLLGGSVKLTSDPAPYDIHVSAPGKFVAQVEKKRTAMWVTAQNRAWIARAIVRYLLGYGWVGGTGDRYLLTVESDAAERQINALVAALLIPNDLFKIAHKKLNPKDEKGNYLDDLWDPIIFGPDGESDRFDKQIRRESNVKEFAKMFDVPAKYVEARLLLNGLRF
jgi:hypothetical protein